MNLRDALLAEIGRSPEERAEFWCEKHRAGYDDWWNLEGLVETALSFGPDDEREAVLREAQARTHASQAQLQEVRNHISTPYESE
jgi:hypothetical protein